MGIVTTWISTANRSGENAVTSSARDIESEAALALDWFITSLINNRTQLEDADKLFDSTDPELGYLGKFLLHKRKLAKKDLRAYASPAELFTVLKPFRAEQAQRVDPTTIPDLEPFARDARGSIWIPKTVEASCAVGKGTEWCTAKYPPGDERNAFDSYNEAGPLYVYFDNKLGKRFQAWSGEYSEDSQVMDEDDEPVNHRPFDSLLRQNGVRIKFEDIVTYTDPDMYDVSKEVVFRILDKVGYDLNDVDDAVIDMVEQVLQRYLKSKRESPEEILDTSPGSGLIAAGNRCIDILCDLLYEEWKYVEEDAEKIYEAGERAKEDPAELLEPFTSLVSSRIEDIPKVIR
jgi:hypothetical protein